MFKNPKRVLLALIALALVLGVISFPENYPLKFSLGPIKVDRVINPPTISLGSLKKEFKTKFGLDLAGGTHLGFAVDMSKIPANERSSALDSVKQVIERRINFFGVSEPVIQSVYSQNTYRVILELPGIQNVDDAISLVGQTAQMEFREFIENAESTKSAYLIPSFTNTKSTDLTGKDLKRASLSFSSQNGSPEVAIEFTSDGSKKFGDLTTRLLGKNLAIFLDDFPLTWPTIQTPILDGRAVITGQFTQEEAKTLALQLNAGALPVPVKLIEQRTVGATLGKESIDKSIRAGLIGLLFVIIYMFLQYGTLGIAAIVGLLFYALLSYGLYRLIPITLTLPGIAGFILSIGMAVDSNILIFERLKEEVRLGKPWAVALESAFGKAWDSIRDANVTTLVTSAILFNPFNWDFLPSSGLVRGFALTLALGVVTSLFTGIIVTRTVMRVFYSKGKS